MHVPECGKTTMQETWSIYRVPRARKRRTGGVEKIETGANKATWVGPGTVIAPDGANLWVSMLGELWRVAREQCRPATTDEHRGAESVLRECAELIEQFKRNTHRAGFKDITGEDFPGEDVGGDSEPSSKRPRLEDQRANVDDGGEMAGLPNHDNANLLGPGSEQQSQEEPEIEVIPSVASDSYVPTTPLSDGSGGALLPEAQPPVEEESQPAVSSAQIPPPDSAGFDRMVDESRRRSAQLDGYHPVHQPRWVRNYQPHNPYYHESEFWLAQADEQEELAEEEWKTRMDELFVKNYAGDQTCWQVDVWQKKLRRVHASTRRGKFSPNGSQDLPVPLWSLGPTRRTVKMKKGRVVKETEDQWRETRGQDGGGSWWCGVTEFDIVNDGVIEAWVAAKKGQDEVNLNNEPPEELPGWRLADASEWAKIAASGAVKVLSVEESRETKAELAMQGKLDRILPTKVARRYKPAEQPGEPPSKKSRLCIRGDLDPDILDLERFSPTVTTANFNVALQLAANDGVTATVGDLKNAFCQSQPLHRANGKLYFKQPEGGIDGLDPEQIILIIAGVYGLVDAPLHWRRSLTEDLRQLGYIPSRLDPCLWKLYHPQTMKLEGIIAIEVDDLFTVGHQHHHEQMAKLREKYTFGKYVILQDEPQGASFNGRRIQQLPDCGFKIDMQKFIEERLHPVELEKGRLKDRKQFATDREVSLARATCGALNWLSKEGRPDAAGPSSLMASKLARLTIEDIVSLNAVVKNLKANSQNAIRIQPLKNMKLSIATDASFANNGYHSQGGQLLLAHEAGLKDGRTVLANVLGWRSGKLQRVVNSTLAAETQSLSRGLGDLVWTMVLIEELRDSGFVMKNWKERVSAEEVLVIASESSSSELKGSLAIVDAKSLYDLLARETVGGSDKRTALEIQIIREDLFHLEGQVRWVDHPAMVADALTKLQGNLEPLYRLLADGVFSIQSEEARMNIRENARLEGQSSSQIRRSGVKENMGAVKCHGIEEHGLTPDKQAS